MAQRSSALPATPFAASFTRSPSPKELADDVKTLSQLQNTTLFATLMAAFMYLLHHYSRQGDIIVGTVVPAGRDQLETQGLMGYFLNPVALRADMSDNPPFSVLLWRIRQLILEALAHDDVPFEEVAKALGSKADPSRTPILQVAAALEPAVPEVGPGRDLTPMDLQSGGTRWDMYFVWEDRPIGITGRVQFNPDHLELPTITRMLRDFVTLLAAVTRAPQIRLSDLPALELDSTRHD
jgi:aspartate racemase